MAPKKVPKQSAAAAAAGGVEGNDALYRMLIEDRYRTLARLRKEMPRYNLAQLAAATLYVAANASRLREVAPLAAGATLLTLLPVAVLLSMKSRKVGVFEATVKAAIVGTSLGVLSVAQVAATAFSGRPDPLSSRSLAGTLAVMAALAGIANVRSLRQFSTARASASRAISKAPLKRGGEERGKK